MSCAEVRVRTAVLAAVQLKLPLSGQAEYPPARTPAGEWAFVDARDLSSPPAL